MQESSVLHLAQTCLTISFMVSLPALLVITVVGLAVSVVQALVQVQEQSVSFILKLVATMATLTLTGPWMLKKLVEFVVTTLENLVDVVQ